MKRLSWTMLAALAIGAIALVGLSSQPVAAAAAAPDAKAMFTDLKCNSCHTVESQGIAVLKEEGEEEEDSKPSDLSNVGATRDAKWLQGWLEKKEQVEGKTHRKKFAGDAAQLKAMATWLATLKTPAK